MSFRLALTLLAFTLLLGSAVAADYSAEPAGEAAPNEEFSDEIRQLVGEAGVKVLKGKRTYLELWPTKQWAAQPGFAPSIEVLYPLEPGALVGVARLKSKLTDFRGQEIKTGLYTVRYGQQPVDGNHVGTAPTRDFFLLLPAAEDQSAATLDKEKLFELSMDAAGSAHPAILYLQAAPESIEAPALEHREEQEWWVLSFANEAKAGDSVSKLPVSLIVVGQGQE